jgi:3-deoxy-manno-octulosonate cytidylyltransferase (CMP-KDO synthetase)
MRVVVIIPSRYGSTRFEGKPLALIAGKPMIGRVHDRARAARHVTAVAVATDDPRIVRAVEGFGGTALMTPSGIRSGTDRVYAAAAAMGLLPGDIVVNVQGDQPVFAPESIDECVAPLLEDPARGMSTLALEIVRESERTDPKDVKVVFDVTGRALYFSRSLIPFGRDPGTEYPVYKHLGIYAYTMECLARFAALPTGILEDIEKLEQLRALEHGMPVHVVVTRHDSPEVDLPGDIPRIEALLAEQGDS